MLGQVIRSVNDVFKSDEYPQLLVGLASPDDAAVYQIDSEHAIISTTDFFPPVVDDPYTFGAIAAANAMSDVYAMGGEVLLATNLAAWPDDIDPIHLSEILRGGAEKVLEAGAVLSGGHTIADQEPKYGLSVVGIVHPNNIFTKGGAQAGDSLLITKPLGSGTITTALKRGTCDLSDLEMCVMHMMALNRLPMQAAQETRAAVHAITDITGFGLLGHAHEMAHLSGCSLMFDWSALPWMDGAHGYAKEMVFPGGTERNAAYYGQWTSFADRLADWEKLLLFDAQTSGGLLLAVDSSQSDIVLSEMLRRGQKAWLVGSAQQGNPGMLLVK